MIFSYVNRFDIVPRLSVQSVDVFKQQIGILTASLNYSKKNLVKIFAHSQTPVESARVYLKPYEKSLKEKSVKIREPKLNEFYNDTLNKCIKGMLFTSMCTEGETIEDGFLPVQDFELPKFKTI